MRMRRTSGAAVADMNISNNGWGDKRDIISTNNIGYLLTISNIQWWLDQESISTIGFEMSPCRHPRCFNLHQLRHVPSNPVQYLCARTRIKAVKMPPRSRSLRMFEVVWMECKDWFQNLVIDHEIFCGPHVVWQVLNRLCHHARFQKIANAYEAGGHLGGFRHCVSDLTNCRCFPIPSAVLSMIPLAVWMKRTREIHGLAMSWPSIKLTSLYTYMYIYICIPIMYVFAHICPRALQQWEGRLNMAQEAFLGLIQSWSHLGQGVRRGWYDPQRFISQTVAVQKQCMTKALCVLKICLQLSSVVVWHKILMMKSRSWPERRADGQRNLSVTETRVKSSVWSTVRV